MPSHIAFLIVVTAVRTNSICSYNHAKYKLTEQTSRTIRWKYFFPTDSPSQLFASVFVLVNCNPKQTKEFIHFGVETVEYNAVTGSSNIKMEMIILYLSQTTRFKHLGTSGSNIKVGNTYLVSGLLKFSDSGKIMIEASDIDFSKLPPLNLIVHEISSSTSSTTHSIIDIIADDIDSNIDKSSTKPSSIKHDNIPASSSSATLSASTTANIETNSSFEKNNYIDLNAEDDDCECDSEHKYDENEDSENDQPKKRKRKPDFLDHGC
ncbi:13563_t:CDS:2 [Dentiscutata heterogama]|uniref:13563_t:CDS:1 n=1 Tax=Dentiscutata heterogama TaxID=1316150 RepID=A0ACA9KYH7_9GLOM|nr:13563_t:CDS:2 [Dentiscutata heterogama]